MTTPNFTGNEPVFSGISILVRSTPRFTAFINAVNSSEALKADIRTIQASNVRFANGGVDSDGTPDTGLNFQPAHNVINMSDDYFVSTPTSSAGLDSSTRTPRQILVEEIRVISHEVSHALRNAEVTAQYGTESQIFQSSGKTNADVNDYINQRMGIGFREEAKAYIDNWNRLVDAGYSIDEVRIILGDRAASSYGADVNVNPATGKIDPASATALASAETYVKVTSPSGYPEGTTYVGTNGLFEIDQAIKLGYVQPGMVLSVNGLDANQLIKAGFSGHIQLADTTTPGAVPTVEVKRGCANDFAWKNFA